MIRAVIFDADGPLYFRTHEVAAQNQELLAKYGYHGDIRSFEEAYEKAKFKAYVQAETPAQMYQSILQSIGIPTTVSASKRFTAEMAHIHEQVTATDDAQGTLRELKNRGLQTCVLTDSFFSTAQKWPWFEKIGLKPYLDSIVSSWDIRLTKNSPEAFIACLGLTGNVPDETIFVGHQSFEMQGARRAGIKSVAVMSLAAPGIQSDYKIASLSELPALIEKLA